MNIDGAAPIRAKLKEIVPEYAYQKEEALRHRAVVAYVEKAVGQYEKHGECETGFYSLCSASLFSTRANSSASKCEFTGLER